MRVISVINNTMLAKLLISKQKLPRYVCMINHIKVKCYSTKSEISPKVVEMPELRLSEHKMKMKQREPFAKNFFRGKYDIEFAAFPEPQTHERHGEFMEWLKPIEEYVKSSIDAEEIDKTGEIPPDIIEDLKNLGVFRAAVGCEYNGLELNSSEYGKLVETLSYVPVLGTYFAKLSVPIKFILDHASDAQKSLYLPQIARGECIPTLCIAENEEGSKGSCISSQVVQSDCGKFWILNGTKSFVVNGNNSNLFIVFADRADNKRQHLNNDAGISAFLVDASSPGIKIDPPVKTLGLRGLSLCRVTFIDTMIPMDNTVGQIGLSSPTFTSIFSDGKQYIGAQAIGITKRYLEAVVENLKKDEDFNAVEFKSDTIQEVVGKITCSIYGMESILYLTTGIADTVSNQDCDLENCIVELYCVDACIKSLLLGTHILGLSSQIDGSTVQRLIRDATCLISIDGTQANLQNAMSLMGLKYLGESIHKKINKLRNPWSHPLETFKKIISREKYDNLLIADNLHPTLSKTAEMLEYGINKFTRTVEAVLIRHGLDVMNRQMDLKRITDAATYLYILAAVVARSSRSYCLGMRDSEKELKIAQVFGYILYRKTLQLIEELNDGNFINGDEMIKDVSNRVFEKNAYFVEHPLARNF